MSPRSKPFSGFRLALMQAMAPAESFAGNGIDRGRVAAIIAVPTLARSGAASAVARPIASATVFLGDDDDQAAVLVHMPARSTIRRRAVLARRLPLLFRQTGCPHLRRELAGKAGIADRHLPMHGGKIGHGANAVPGDVRTRVVATRGSDDTVQVEGSGAEQLAKAGALLPCLREGRKTRVGIVVEQRSGLDAPITRGAGARDLGQ